MQKEIKKRTQWYAVIAVLLAITLGSMCHNLGFIPGTQKLDSRVSMTKSRSSRT